MRPALALLLILLAAGASPALAQGAGERDAGVQSYLYVGHERREEDGRMMHPFLDERAPCGGRLSVRLGGACFATGPGETTVSFLLEDERPGAVNVAVRALMSDGTVVDVGVGCGTTGPYPHSWGADVPPGAAAILVMPATGAMGCGEETTLPPTTGTIRAWFYRP